MSESTQEFNSVPDSNLRCCWPLRDGTLPLEHRHVTALTERGAGASLYAWVRSRVEQLLSGEFPVKHPNGMIVVSIDPTGEVVVTIEERQTEPTPEDLAIKLSPEGAIVDGANSSVWLRLGDTVITPPSPPAVARGTRSLTLDLARTLGYNVSEDLIYSAVMEDADEAFIVSDLFGVIALNDRGGKLAQQVADGYAKVVG